MDDLGDPLERLLLQQSQIGGARVQGGGDGNGEAGKPAEKVAQLVGSLHGEAIEAVRKDDWIPQDTAEKKEVGAHGFWSISTCKPGFGVAQLRDGSLDTYWQSDGPQPHHVNLQFTKKTSLSHLFFYLDYQQDESYTPSKISIRAGSCHSDLQELLSCTLTEPTGWQCVSLVDSQQIPLQTHMLQMEVLANHQNGKDTHIRQVLVFSPRLCYQASATVAADNQLHHLQELPSVSHAFDLYSILR